MNGFLMLGLLYLLVTSNKRSNFKLLMKFLLLQLCLTNLYNVVVSRSMGNYTTESIFIFQQTIILRNCIIHSCSKCPGEVDLYHCDVTHWFVACALVTENTETTIFAFIVAFTSTDSQNNLMHFAHLLWLNKGSFIHDVLLEHGQWTTPCPSSLCPPGSSDFSVSPIPFELTGI